MLHVDKDFQFACAENPYPVKTDTGTDIGYAVHANKAVHVVVIPLVFGAKGYARTFRADTIEDALTMAQGYCDRKEQRV